MTTQINKDTLIAEIVFTVVIPFQSSLQERCQGIMSQDKEQCIDYLIEHVQDEPNEKQGHTIQ